MLAYWVPGPVSFWTQTGRMSGTLACRAHDAEAVLHPVACFATNFASQEGVAIPLSLHIFNNCGICNRAPVFSGCTERRGDWVCPGPGAMGLGYSELKAPIPESKELTGCGGPSHS